jgi:RNA polymerase sigma-70 factor, ECF subfamily
MMDRDERLCDRARTGDTAAAEQLIELHYAGIYAYLRRRCGSDSDAEDLTQRTFLKVWGSLGSFQQRSTFATWIHGIAHNVYVDWRRRRSVMDSQADEWWETCAAQGPSPFEDVAERELAHRVYALVEQLDEETKEAIHFHYYQGLSLKETCDVLGVPASTLKYRLREGLNTLRAQAAEPKFTTGPKL